MAYSVSDSLNVLYVGLQALKDASKTISARRAKGIVSQSEISAFNKLSTETGKLWTSLYIELDNPKDRAGVKKATGKSLPLVNEDIMAAFNEAGKALSKEGFGCIEPISGTVCALLIAAAILSVGAIVTTYLITRSSNKSTEAFAKQVELANAEWFALKDCVDKGKCDPSLLSKFPGAGSVKPPDDILVTLKTVAVYAGVALIAIGVMAYAPTIWRIARPKQALQIS